MDCNDVPHFFKRETNKKILSFHLKQPLVVDERQRERERERERENALFLSLMHVFCKTLKSQSSATVEELI